MLAHETIPAHKSPWKTSSPSGALENRASHRQSILSPQMRANRQEGCCIPHLRDIAEKSRRQRRHTCRHEQTAVFSQSVDYGCREGYSPDLAVGAVKQHIQFALKIFFSATNLIKSPRVPKFFVVLFVKKILKRLRKVAHNHSQHPTAFRPLRIPRRNGNVWRGNQPGPSGGRNWSRQGTHRVLHGREP